MRLRRRRRQSGPYSAELMLCWLLVKIRLSTVAGGRSEKRDPFWTRALWARKWSEMKTRVRGPMWKVMMGPYLGRSLRRWGSRSRKGLVSHLRLPKKGRVGGPGGCLGLVKRSLRDNAKQMEREMEIRNHQAM